MLVVLVWDLPERAVLVLFRLIGVERGRLGDGGGDPERVLTLGKAVPGVLCRCGHNLAGNVDHPVVRDVHATLENLDGRVRRVEGRIERVGHDDGRRLVLLGHIGKRLGDVKRGYLPTLPDLGLR